MQRRHFLTWGLAGGLAGTILAGLGLWWRHQNQPAPHPPNDVKTPAQTAAPTPAAKSGAAPAQPKAPPAMPKTSIRPNLPQYALDMESPEAAQQRGHGQDWRKRELEASVSAEKWLAVTPLSAPGFGARSGQSLVLDDGVLRRHVGEIPLEAGRVVVAIRGARPASPALDFAAVQSLTITPPDHLNFCCTLAVWDPDTARIAVYAGSTVPNRTAIVSSALGVQSANMLLPGIFTYVPGPHSNYAKYGFPFSIVGAIRQNSGSTGAGPLACLRATSPAGMQGARRDLTRDDNIHCAETPLLEPWDRFSSEGCLVVAGRYTPKEGHTGPWARFRASAATKGRAKVSVVLVNSTDLA